ncbi:hypothetical protein BDD12DRAFT_107398 [Trichophaea hybrida]|nr:hypothetical protein BDD12DRAFT_107398 [Trichophaea hybrida]
MPYMPQLRKLLIIASAIQSYIEGFSVDCTIQFCWILSWPIRPSIPFSSFPFRQPHHQKIRVCCKIAQTTGRRHPCINRASKSRLKLPRSQLHNPSSVLRSFLLSFSFPTCCTTVVVLDGLSHLPS